MSSLAIKNSYPEILAPAGSFDSVVAAVRCGANAVYLGAKQFSARASAQNFDINELDSTVKYCHERGVKVYLALNTAVYDHELKDAAALISSAAQIGVDALIVSDLGVISLARKICPELSLHGSTQMGVASLSGANAAKTLGLDRIVLAREMSANEIAKVTKDSDIETEAFVHGAHCMCVSGQCYFSAMLGSRSGNRGRCAQPCRLDFGIEGSNLGYALSLKDMSLAAHLKELSDMGVSSFKIEGRMKRPEYVASAVSLISASLQSQKVDEQLFELAEDIFSRSGFTDGYYKSQINGKMFGFRTRDNVESSKSALAPIHELYRKERQSVSLNLSLCATAEKGITLTAQDEDNNTVSAFADSTQLIDGEFNEQKAHDNLSRLGSTPYFAKNIELSVQAGKTVSPSLLNSLRREATAALSSKRSEKPSRQIFKADLPKPAHNPSKNQQIYARFENIGQFVESKELCDKAILPIAELSQNSNKISCASKIIAELPRHAFSNDAAIEQQLKILSQTGIDTVCIQNIGQLSLVKSFDFKIMFGPFMNVFNSETLSVLKQNGVQSAVASFELSEKSIIELESPIELGALVYGHIPLMITRACPLKKKGDCKTCAQKGGFLTDRTGRKMPIICRGVVSEIYNADVLAADLAENKFSTTDFLLCYFTVESKERCKKVLEGIKSNKTVPVTEGFTRGLYKKGVI